MTASALGYKVELDVFEGPLDLLLHLVRKHELDILDIPIAFITEKYLEYLDLMQALSLDVAGEYLLMAATLAHIKSRELLPSDRSQDDAEDEEGEDEIDPRQDLIRRLLEYQKYKTAASSLGERPVVGRNVWTRGLPKEDALAENIDPETAAPLMPFAVTKLIEALDRVLKRAKIKLAHDVLVERLSVTDRINELADRLEQDGSLPFSSCFRFLDPGVQMSADSVRHEIVVTFLALLEMAKLQLIALSQPEGEDDIHIARATDNVRERVAETVARDDEYR
ncbi:MAG: segregation/condensation protein A [Proteobacteria bacterium]|nr:segregation/condensation protein A [Pseudomonadota bacterium]